MLSVQQLFRKIFWESIVIALLLLPCVGLLALQSKSPLDWFIYDKLMPLVTPPIDPRIVLITIDDSSISSLGRWPWPRDIHTLLLDKLAPYTPKAVVYDVIFTEPDPDPDVDVRLGEAMARIGTVVVPTLRQSDQQADELPEFMSPIRPVAQGAKSVGHIYVAADDDGVVRRVNLREGSSKGQLSQLTWLAYEGIFPAGSKPAMPPGCCRVNLGGNWFGWNETFIPFNIGSNPLANSISAADVIKGNVNPDRLRDKIILIGATASGLGDRYPTPLASSEGAVAGMVVNAYILNGLLNDFLIIAMPRWLTVSISVMAVLIVLGLFLTFRVRHTFLVCSGLIVACLILSLALLSRGVWWSPATSVMGIALAYVLWSWRRLTVVVTYFGLELDRMAHELQSQPAVLQPTYRGDMLIHRTLALEAMIDNVRDSRRFVAQSLNSIPMAIFVTDLDGQVLLANHSAVTLHAGKPQANELTVKDIFQILRDIEDFDETRSGTNDSPWHNSRRETQQLAGQFVTAPSGRIFKIRVAPLDTEKSEPTGWLVGLIEFTVERLAEEQRDSMLRFLSHDLRAPQSAILALLAMQERDPDPLNASELRRHIEHQVRRTLHLTDGFMLLDAAKSKPQIIEEVYLGAIALDALDQVWPLAQNNNMRFERTFLQDENCVVNGSAELLTRAIFNLLENAVKYSDPSTTVHMRLSRQENEALLEIRDEGHGISEEDLPQLFDEFHQFGRGNTRGEGYGLGMAFVSQVIQRHGARIECVSQLNVGTTFRLFFKAI